MKLESEYKSKLVEQSKELGAYARRFEDRYAVGILDTIIMYPRYRAFWIEGKIVRGLTFQPTERQYIEGQRIQKAGGTPLLVGWDDQGTIYISKWAKVASVTNTYKREGKSYGQALKEWIEDTQSQIT